MAITLEFRLTVMFDRERFRRKRERMAVILLNQVQERIVNGGDEEGAFAPLDFPRPNGSSANPLYDTGEHILRSLSSGTAEDEIHVGSNFIGMRVQALGTEGKGGKLPTIRPVTAGGLFIPLSPLGAKSVKVAGRRYGTRRRKGVKEMVPLSPGRDFIIRDHVDIRARNPFRLTRRNIAELMAELWS